MRAALAMAVSSTVLGVACKFPYPPDVPGDGDTVDAGTPDGANDAASPDAPVDARLPTCTRRVVYTIGSPGAREVWTAETDGSASVNVSNNAADDLDPSWSPDGTRVLFRSNRSGNWDLWSVRVDGTAPTNLTRSATDDTFAVWSPDGTKIAFARASGLWVMAADGTLATQLASMSVSGTIAWSPSGTTLVFGHKPDGVNQDLFTIVVVGGTPRNLTSTASSESGGAWSPDGTRIVFARAGTGGNSDLWTIGNDGSGAVNLTENTPATYDVGGLWTTDGAQVIFTSNREGGYKLFRVPALGGPITRVSDHGLSGGITGDWLVAIARDDQGDRALFTRYLPQNHYQVGTVDVSGAGQSTFTDAAQTAFAGGWSPCL